MQNENNLKTLTIYLKKKNMKNFRANFGVKLCNQKGKPKMRPTKLLMI